MLIRQAMGKHPFEKKFPLPAHWRQRASQTSFCFCFCCVLACNLTTTEPHTVPNDEFTNKPVTEEPQLFFEMCWPANWLQKTYTSFWIVCLVAPRTTSDFIYTDSEYTLSRCQLWFNRWLKKSARFFNNIWYVVSSSMWEVPSRAIRMSTQSEIPETAGSESTTSPHNAFFTKVVSPSSLG